MLTDKTMHELYGSKQFTHKWQEQFDREWNETIADLIVNGVNDRMILITNNMMDAEEKAELRRQLANVNYS